MTRLAALLCLALALATPAGAGPVAGATDFLLRGQLADGGFAEAGAEPDVSLTAWAALGLRAAGAPTGSAGAFLAERGEHAGTATELELALLARAALGADVQGLVARVRSLARPDGRIGPTLNSTVWGILALRQAGAPAPASSRRYLLASQARSGGWSWASGVAPDSNDTAAAIQALRSVGVAGTPIRRGLAFLRKLRNRDGGFELTAGRGSDAQSTAWAIQAFLAAGERPGAAAYRYLAALRRPDGSYRYNARYAVTPVWVTAQVLPALAGKAFPLP